MIQKKIRSDSHGPYIRINGCVYRPQIRIYQFAIFGGYGQTKFKSGDKVLAKHNRYTPTATVQIDNIKEIWHNHGCYFDKSGKHISSENCWES